MSLEIFYDGECIFCQSYVRLMNLRKAAGQVELISVRSDDPRILMLEDAGYNLNNGMVVRHKGRIFYGSEAMQVLNRLEQLVSEPDYRPGRIMHALYKGLYPVLVLGRFITLFLLGRSMHSRAVSHALPHCAAPHCYTVFRQSVMLMLGFFIACFGLVLVKDNTQLVVQLAQSYFADPLVVMGKEITADKLSFLLEHKAPLSQLFVITGFIFTFVIAFSFFIREIFARRLFDAMLQGQWLAWLLYIVVSLALVNLLSGIFIRRVAFAIVCLPIAALLVRMALAIYRDKQGGKLPSFLVMIMACALVIPGFYMPPFFDGISGWVVQFDEKPKQHSLTAYKLIRDDGAEQWYSHSLFNPVTMNGRFVFAFRDKGSEAELVAFMIDNYKRLWPDILSKGLMPHQMHLGQFGYPPHNKYNRSFDYKDWAPARIVALEKVTEVKDSDGALISKTILAHYPFVFASADD